MNPPDRPMSRFLRLPRLNNLYSRLPKAATTCGCCRRCASTVHAVNQEGRNRAVWHRGQLKFSNCVLRTSTLTHSLLNTNIGVLAQRIAIPWTFRSVDISTPSSNPCLHAGIPASFGSGLNRRTTPNSSETASSQSVDLLFALNLDVIITSF
ncbi:hypothetical protein N7G274_001918 [Stereocaulon virgatum]|uniref:Uncharacterized protein n=1 Tax=Stereocaulon virgatum TaxID=373712 RepID=A0ABR4AJ57_9LECA